LSIKVSNRFNIVHKNNPSYQSLSSITFEDDDEDEDDVVDATVASAVVVGVVVEVAGVSVEVAGGTVTEVNSMPSPRTGGTTVAVLVVADGGDEDDVGDDDGLDDVDEGDDAGLIGSGAGRDNDGKCG
jgi:hypothetical protein